VGGTVLGFLSLVLGVLMTLFSAGFFGNSITSSYREATCKISLVLQFISVLILVDLELTKISDAFNYFFLALLGFYVIRVSYDLIRGSQKVIFGIFIITILPNIFNFLANQCKSEASDASF
jgi:hypothetical protein